jgi:hypothetical protein
MAKVKLTLSIDEKLLQRAKMISKIRGKSLSVITEEFYKKLCISGKTLSLANQLLGCAEGPDSIKSDFEIKEMYMQDKHEKNSPLP